MKKIDLVYLWVDGNDPAHRAKKNRALAGLGRPAPKWTDEPAKDDYEELKYSLRSVEKFAPWINHIYIVTDGHRPAWLNADNPKVTIVDHAEIIPKDLLPTFNSNMIEFFIYKIPGLSEHFLYANDDMFFGKPVEPDFFFDETGNPIVIMGRKKWPKSYYTGATSFSKFGLYKKTCANALKYAYDKTGVKFPYSFKHAIEPFRKSYFKENIEKDFEFWKKTTFTPFREVTNVQRIVLTFLDNAKNRNKIVGTCTVDGRRTTPRAQLDLYYIMNHLRGRLQVDNISLYRVGWLVQPTTFCVNSTWALNSFKLNHGAMNKLFPNKSGFEK